MFMMIYIYIYILSEKCRILCHFFPDPQSFYATVTIHISLMGGRKAQRKGRIRPRVLNDDQSGPALLNIDPALLPKHP